MLTVNLRGYPGSDRPETAAGYNVEELTRDVLAALDYLGERPEVDATRLTLLGHSYGAGLVIPVLLQRPSLPRAVIYGPSIWVVETTTGPTATHREFYHERYWRYMDGVEPVPLADYLSFAEDIYIPAQVAELRDGHSPILLLDGGAEKAETLEFSTYLLDLLPPPCDYWSIPRTDHFCNTAAFGPFIVEDRAAIEALAGKLDDWLDWR